jgi:diaminopimelate epimerase
MRFTKMHGAGNDYVYVNCFAEKFPADPASLAIAMSDRHKGIGGDGVIFICPSDNADVRMRMYNADGSEAEMCGNGIRCVAKYVYDHGIARKPRLTIETGRGVLTLDLTVANDKVTKVRVDMGEPILESKLIPVRLDGTPPKDEDVWFTPSESIRLTCVSMGNPHAVAFVNEITDDHVFRVGKLLERHEVFPKRSNIEFVKVHSKSEATMRVWERGSGETLACGTGACAVLVAGVVTGRLDRKATIHLLGGDLELEWNEANNHVYKTGPATDVFSGEWPE